MMPCDPMAVAVDYRAARINQIVGMYSSDAANQYRGRLGASAHRRGRNDRWLSLWSHAR
jgi:hypothetical protein